MGERREHTGVCGAEASAGVLVAEVAPGFRLPEPLGGLGTTQSKYLIIIIAIGLAFSAGEVVRYDMIDRVVELKVCDDDETKERRDSVSMIIGILSSHHDHIA